MIEIKLTKGRTATIDDVDADLAAFKWCSLMIRGQLCYATREFNGKMILLHRVIAERMLGNIEGKIVDHIDREPTNCRRSNLRIVTPQQSQQNRGRRCDNGSGFIGVCWNKRDKGWQANARSVDGRKRHLGLFDTALEAALARDEFVAREHGPFAVFNFPEVFGKAT